MIDIQNPILFAYTLGFLFTSLLIIYIYMDISNTRKK